MIQKITEEHDFIVETLHPLTHVNMFLDESNTQSVYIKHQKELYNNLVNWISKILNKMIG